MSDRNEPKPTTRSVSVLVSVGFWFSCLSVLDHARATTLETVANTGVVRHFAASCASVPRQSERIMSPLL